MSFTYDRFVCIHEAGHAVAAYRLLGGFAYVAVRPIEKYGRYVRGIPKDDLGICVHYGDAKDARQALRHAVVSIAGIWAESRYLGVNPDDCIGIPTQGDDISQARDALALIGLDEAAYALAERKASELIEADWHNIQHLACQLLRSGRVEGENWRPPYRAQKLAMQLRGAID